MNIYDLISKNRLVEVLAVTALFGCGGDVETPAPVDPVSVTAPAPAVTEPAPERVTQAAAPPTLHVEYAPVVWYHLNNACTDDVTPLALAAAGSTPQFAQDDDGRAYVVVERYDGAIWLDFNDQCPAGGPYEGYDLFKVESLRP